MSHADVDAAQEMARTKRTKVLARTKGTRRSRWEEWKKPRSWEAMCRNLQRLFERKEASRGTEAESRAPVHNPKRRRREEEDGTAGHSGRPLEYLPLSPRSEREEPLFGPGMRKSADFGPSQAECRSARRSRMRSLVVWREKFVRRRAGRAPTWRWGDDRCSCCYCGMHERGAPEVPWVLRSRGVGLWWRHTSCPQGWRDSRTCRLVCHDVLRYEIDRVFRMLVETTVRAYKAEAGHSLGQVRGLERRYLALRACFVWNEYCLGRCEQREETRNVVRRELVRNAWFCCRVVLELRPTKGEFELPRDLLDASSVLSVAETVELANPGLRAPPKTPSEEDRRPGGAFEVNSREQVGRW